MAQSVFANPRPRYHKTDDPLADLAAITGFRSEGDPRSVDDFALDLEQELLGAFGGQEEAEAASERSLDAELDAGFATEFAAAPHDHLADDLDAAFDAEFDATGIEPANSNAQPAAEWEDFPLDEEVAYETVQAASEPEAPAQPFGSVFDAPAEAEALVDLDFSDFDPADFEVAAAPEAAAAPVDAEPDFEAELFARIESEPAHPPVSGVPPQSSQDFEAELSAALGFADEPAPSSRPAPAAAPAASAPAAVAPAPSDPFAELAALAASYKAVRPSVFARAPNWTLRRDEPAAVQPAAAPVAPMVAAPAPAVQPAAAPVEEPVADDFAIEAADDAAEATYEPVDYVEEAVPATDEFDLPDFEFAAGDAPEAWSDIAIDYEPQPVAPAAARPEAEPALDAVEGEFSDFFGIELERLQREEREAAAAAAAARPLDAAATRSLEEELAIAPARLAPAPANRRGLFLAGGVAAVALLGGIAAFAFMGGDAVPSQPAVIKADTDPVKVKPANPGGAEIANQDKAVYDKVAGAEASGATEQTALVSTSEEPVDVNAAAAERAPAAKSEDRVAAAPQEGETAAGGVAAVQPKKVRTLIVKPDGTLVAQEAPAEPAPVAAAAEAPAAETPAGAGVAYQPPGAGLAAEEAPVQEEPVVVASAAPEADPVKAAIAADPVEPQQPAVAGEDAAAKKAADAKARKAAEAKAKAKAEAKAKAKAEQAAAAEATEATPAAGGEWSIQIASQPSREGAQASYKALSGKFGSIIGGRGVAIVQAEIPNKGTFYRVRVPAGSKADANELCARYQAAGGSCFITR